MSPVRVMRLALGAALLVLGVPSALAAQERRDTTARRDTTLRRDTTAARDSLAGRDTLPPTVVDSSAPRELVEWAAADSIMRELESRQGYTVTRYQGERVRFRADQRTIYLEGDPSAVGRGQTVMVGDTITYNDSTQVIIALGDTLVLRDPEQQSDDLLASGRLVYRLRTREGVVTNISTVVESGERWIIAAHTAAFKGDTTGDARTAFYAREGILTSCEETEPHYHFASRDMKVVAKSILVARPAILYIKDIPVLWLPFVFQDLRSGRRSGLIFPRIGFSEVVRNSPTYRRTIEDFGWYWAINNYLDFETTMDWRSSARATPGDPGWTRFRGQLNYRWLDRFLNGSVSAAQFRLKDGSRNNQLSWSHSQQFSSRSSLTMNLNYASNTTVQKQTTFNPYAALATIRSQLNYQQQIGGWQMSIGGNRTQYTGREQVDMDFPSLSITTQPIGVGDWFTWTPTLQLQNQQSFDVDQTGNPLFRYTRGPGGALDSVLVSQDTRNSSLAFNTPIKIFGFEWQNRFRVSESENNFPQQFTFYENADSARRVTRVFARNYRTEVDWETGITLPSFFGGTWNLSPSVNLQNVAPGGMLVRTHFTGDRYVSQPKRLSYGLSASPTFYGLFGGFGPVTRFRHAINPSITYSYSPRAKVDDEFLEAIGQNRQSYIGSLAQNQVTLNLNTNLEARLRSASDTALEDSPDNARKVKVLSLNFTPVTYDFARAAEARRRGRANAYSGFATERFGYTLRSDLLPGFDIGVDYSLFEGSILSDTAKFSPYRESIRASLSLDKDSPILRAIGRLFGIDFARQAAQPTDTSDASTVGAVSGRIAGLNQSIANQPVAGSVNRAALAIPSGRGFNTTLSFSSVRQRPVVGAVTIDPLAECQPFRLTNPFAYEQCVLRKTIAPGTGSPFAPTTAGGPIFQSPPQTNLQGSMSFNITPKWAAQWSTTYDFVTKDFASHIVSLQRELHDWNAIFAFTQSPNGNFAFNFFIALRAQPELKFNYDRRSIRRSETSGSQ